MAHYALLNEQNVVVQVIVGKDETDTSHNWEEFYSIETGHRCLRTSYNTHGNKHTGDGQPFRGNYAGIGYSYDETLDAFIPPQPYASWSLDPTSCLWIAPVPYPDDGKFYIWSEEAQEWILVEGLSD